MCDSILSVQRESLQELELSNTAKDRLKLYENYHKDKLSTANIIRNILKFPNNSSNSTITKGPTDRQISV